jgi:hypothetical protein
MIVTATTAEKRVVLANRTWCMAGLPGAVSFARCRRGTSLERGHQYTNVPHLRRESVIEQRISPPHCAGSDFLTEREGFEPSIEV